MKILIASDIHGDKQSCQRVLEIFEDRGAEWLLLLGDLLYHGPRNPIPTNYDPQGVAELLCAHKECAFPLGFFIKFESVKCINGILEQRLTAGDGVLVDL